MNQMASASSSEAPAATIAPCRGPRARASSAGTAPGRKKKKPMPKNGSRPSSPVANTAPPGFVASQLAIERFIEAVRAESGAAPARSVLIGVRQQREKPRALHRQRELTLVVRACARDPARDDLARLGDVALERRQILVIDLLDAFGGELAELAAAEKACHGSPVECVGLGPIATGFAARRDRLVATIAILRRRFVSAHALLLLGHRRRLDYGARYRHDEVTDHRIAEAKRTGEFVERLLVALDIHQHVMCLVDLGDRIRKLPAAPVLETMHRALAGGDHAPVPSIIAGTCSLW